ncbi:MAG: hypothetical protein Tsb0020_13790 [Haliangiales bacterium]
MKYLYGDATPFPLEENFIDTLAAATDACVALFKTDLDLRNRHDRSDELRERASEELSYLDRLATTLETAIAPMLPKEEAAYAAQKTAVEISQSTRALIERARANIISGRDANIRGIIGSDTSTRVQRSISSFVLEHTLPKTSWDVVWSYDWDAAKIDLSLTSSAECGLVAEFTGTIPSDDRWSIPQRISDIDPHTQLTIQRDVGWLSRLLKGSHESISGFFITRVEMRGNEARFQVHRALKPGASGYEISIRSAKHGSPVVLPLRESDAEVEAIPVYGDDAVNLTSLWAIIEKELRALTRYRERMLRARLRGADIGQLDEPGELAEIIIMTLAPIVREMRMRSRVPGELVLKRDLGNGRREELFVPRQELTRKFASLPHEQQRYFHAAGLGGEATVDFMHRSIASAPQTPPLQAPAEADEDDDPPTDVPSLRPASARTGDAAA